MAKEGLSYSLAASQVQYEFRLLGWLVEEIMNDMVYCMHSQPVASVNQRRSSLGLFHEIAKEMWLGVIEALDASFGDD